MTAVNSGITKISPTTLQNMWDKAEELMNDSSAITPAPGKDKTARMVLSYSSAIPSSVILDVLIGGHQSCAPIL